MLEMPELMELLQLDDLKTPAHQELAQIIGMEAFRKLVLTYGGSDPYIPQASELVRPIRDSLILREYNGENERALARKWGMSERRIRELTKEKDQSMTEEALERQAKLY